MTTERAVSEDAVEAAIRAAEAAHGMGATVTRPMMRAALLAASPFLAGEGVALRTAALAVLDDWDERMPDGPEQFKEGEFGKYWSPSSSMVQSKHMAALRSALSAPPPQPEVAGLVEALGWYAEMVRNCRKLPGIPEGDVARHALDADGGKRARAALASMDGR